MVQKFSLPDAGVIDKYETRVNSWYTLYPIHSFWKEDEFAARAQIEVALDEYCEDSRRADLELYVHFPYCSHQCYFCQCSTVISRNYGHYSSFLDTIEKEVNWYVDAFEKRGHKPAFREIHFGGGSPSLLSIEDFEKLTKILSRIVDWSVIEECALEIDPRFSMDKEKLHAYADNGVSRISFGVQDFDPEVQEAINRRNPPEMIQDLITSDVRSRFSGVNFDILFGLPKQTVQRHVETMETLLSMKPDRTNICLLGHRPDVFPHQKAYRTEDIASTSEKMEMKVASLNMMLDAGYDRIGIDHYALGHDSFVEAKKKKTLQRNINGYGNGRGTDTLGIGPSAVSTLGRHYIQNYYTLSDYQKRIDEGVAPVVRSNFCDDDDLIRRNVIFDLIMYEQIDKTAFGEKWDINFDNYFADSLERLSELEDDGLIVLDETKLTLTETGQLMPRHACFEFDNHQHGRGKVYRHNREVGNGKSSLKRSLHFMPASQGHRE